MKRKTPLIPHTPLGSKGDGASNDGGVRETEVLELSQRWADLRERDAFNLLALERAVKQVTVTLLLYTVYCIETTKRQGKLFISLRGVFRIL